jgi:peptidoglycan hydrolase CwlO-like protein
MTKALITALITVLVTGSVAMIFRVSEKTQTHEARISVLEDHEKGMDKKLDKMDDKLDILLARRDHGSRPTQ